jgi:DNA-binding MarR family transcriptional regulator
MTQSSTPPPSQASPSDTQYFLANQWKLNQALARHLTPLMESNHGVGLKDLMVLGHIRSGVRYPTDLADVLQIPRHMASRAIDDLLTARLIERSFDPADGRRTRLTISAEGQTLLSAAFTTVDAAVQQLFAHIPEDQRAQVLSAIDTLAQAAQTAFGGHQ